MVWACNIGVNFMRGKQQIGLPGLNNSLCPLCLCGKKNVRMGDNHE